MLFTSLLKYHLLHEAHTDHPSEAATFVDPHAYTGVTFLTALANLSADTGTTVGSLCPPHQNTLHEANKGCLLLVH